MGDKMLEIEEELDLSLLGLEADLSSGSSSDTAVDRASDPITLSSATKLLSSPPSFPATALDLLRAITESYHPSDSTLYKGELFSTLPTQSTHPDKSTAQHNDRVFDKGIPVYHEYPIPHDYATELPSSAKEGDRLHLAALDMEKTESYISTIPSESVLSHLEQTKSPRVKVRWVQTRLPGRRRYRNALRVIRASSPPPSIVGDPADQTSEELSQTSQPTRPPPPPPPTVFQRDLSDIYGTDVLDKIERQSKLDSTSGNSLPPVLRDLFPALADVNTTIKIANVFRRQLDLPLLSIKTDKIALRRSIAKMREGLYTEIMCGLTLPLAPKSVETEDELDTNDERVTLTPISLQVMGKKLPKIFPAEKSLIKSFLIDDHKLAYGEKLGQVVWQGGVGKMRGKGECGFRGKWDTDGLTHIYVDHSNILHGLLQHLFANPSDALPPRHLRTLSLPALSLLLRRGRHSPPGSLHLVASSPLQQNLDSLVRLGWEISVLKRVELYEDEVEDPNSMKVSSKPQSRISTHGDIGLRRYREQGVDEILHLKMLQIINEKGFKAEKGSTLVLATGDARGGQFNKDGFPGAVREALKRGWNVELWSFTSGLSRAWKETAKREKWYELGKFTIWALDDWAEQLVEVGEESF
ncbi:uncharacterized protein IL334_004477 [Kwoniella shivajii]|uniref:NYN domain-containing protein n=1 Tax=Kwoniella shivajii TaxID=564305 RepID=A0ABZ1D269_9TREE|nr:hypothetical protein IL334_004477 [Kwoniella shivajii]